MAWVATQIGNWTDPATWTAGVDYPGKVGTTADQTVDLNGYAVTFDVATMDVRIGTITTNNNTSSTKLIWDITKSTHMLIRGKLEFNYYEELKIGTESAPLPAEFTATIEYDLASNGEYGKGNFSARGYILFYGAKKTPSVEISGDLSVSDTNVTLATTPVGWRDGDTLCILSSSETDTARYTEVEYIVATSISGTSVTLASGVSYAHSDGTQILNVTRNIRFTSTNSAYQPSSFAGQSHTMIFEGVEFYQAGGMDGFYTGYDYPQIIDNCVVRGSNSYGMSIGYTIKCGYKDIILCDNALGGMMAAENSNTSDWENCYFVDNIGEGAEPFHIKYAGAAFFFNCTFACNVGSGLRIGRQPGFYVSNCYSYGNYGYGLETTNGGAVNVQTSYFGSRPDGTTQTNFNADIYLNDCNVYLNDCKFDSIDLMDVANSRGTRMWSTNHNQVAGVFKGYDSDNITSVSTDTTVYRTTSPSIKIDSNSSGEASLWKIPIKVNSGDNLSIDIYGKREGSSMWHSPRLDLTGCGISEYDSFTIEDTAWNKVTIGGTATREGIVMLSVIISQQNPTSNAFWIDDINVTVT